jgi:hypothetical protein
MLKSLPSFSKVTKTDIPSRCSTACNRRCYTSSFATAAACMLEMLWSIIQNGYPYSSRSVPNDNPNPTALLLLTVHIQGLLAEEFYYIWMQFTVKMCFLLFYRRLSEERWFQRALYGVIGFHAVTTVVIWLLYALQCMPLAAFYDPLGHPGVTCLPTGM